MKYKHRFGVILLSLAFFPSFSFGQENEAAASGPGYYEPTWESLSKHGTAPDWYEDAVLGIYFHWGIYSVSAHSAEKYPRDMYMEGRSVHEHHRETYGDPCEFGYHDFIPMFRGEKWDPDAWAELFHYAGADIAGSIGEHCDGFAMWDTEYNDFNAMKMGPCRDVVGEMAEAVRKKGMKVITTFHHARWDYYDAGRMLCPEGVGVNDPALSGLYGPVHKPGDPISEEFVEQSYNKVIEVIDKYRPDHIQIDGGALIGLGPDNVKKFLAYYFNSAEGWGREVVVSRGFDRKNPVVQSEIWGKEVMISRIIPLGVAVQNIEYHFPKWTMHRANPEGWQTSTPIPGFRWAYIAERDNMSPEEIYRHTDELVDGIVDMTSKNGLTLTGVTPRADGTIPEAQVKILRGLGDWMKVNKSALYGSNWRTRCEDGSLRFIDNDGDLLAIDLEKPDVPEIILGVTVEPGSVIRMQGSDQELRWHQDGDDLVIEELPDPLPCDHAWVFRIKEADPAILY